MEKKYTANLKMSVILTSLSFAIWLLGDRPIGAVVWLHMIPEMAGIFFLGAYLNEIQLASSVGMASAYLLMSLFTFTLLGLHSNCWRWEFLMIIFVIGSGFLFGYLAFKGAIVDEE